jgi:hypothetical protein
MHHTEFYVWKTLTQMRFAEASPFVIFVEATHLDALANLSLFLQTVDGGGDDRAEAQERQARSHHRVPL